jgi:hypothetical protein
MTFELLKVCRQANPTWIELQVMTKRNETNESKTKSTKTKRNRLIRRKWKDNGRKKIKDKTK